ncbi:hypothetical protein ZWY2020_015207 [Hordeum vulgare]|nr:hypothetical protein ZWY2020_015207 [Hordeum vulgare]
MIGRRVDSASAVAVLLLAASAAAVADAATGSTVVAGMVFCDQCKDGARSLFDYPLYGARVAIQCGGGDTPMTVRECNTNWFGGFSVRMEGSPDMNRCTARVVHATGHCSAAANAEPRELTLAFRMLGLALYTVLPLLSQPEQAMDFCPRAGLVTPQDPAAAAATPSPPMTVTPRCILRCPSSGAAGSCLPSGAARRRCRSSQSRRLSPRRPRLPQPKRRPRARARRARMTSGGCRSTGATGRW